MAVINNVAYSWSMITLASTALGVEEGSTTLEGVSGIKWNKNVRSRAITVSAGDPYQEVLETSPTPLPLQWTMLPSKPYEVHTVR